VGGSDSGGIEAGSALEDHNRNETAAAMSLRPNQPAANSTSAARMNHPPAVPVIALTRAIGPDGAAGDAGAAPEAPDTGLELGVGDSAGEGVGSGVGEGIGCAAGDGLGKRGDFAGGGAVDGVGDGVGSTV